MSLQAKHIKALAWAVREAKTWRGALIGAASQRDINDFDKKIKDAENGLRILRRES